MGRHQPRTQLEVMTLAYAALNILVFALWWDKPLNIQELIYVHGRASPRISRTQGLRGLWSIMGNAFELIQASGGNDSIIFTVLVSFLVEFTALHGASHFQLAKRRCCGESLRSIVLPHLSLFFCLRLFLRHHTDISLIGSMQCLEGSDFCSRQLEICSGAWATSTLGFAGPSSGLRSWAFC